MCVVKYKFTSKTGGFESYDSHQLLCGGMVEVNSEPFRIAWFGKRLHIDIHRIENGAVWSLPTENKLWRHPILMRCMTSSVLIYTTQKINEIHKKGHLVPTLLL